MPSIYKKNLKNLRKNIKFIEKSESTAKLNPIMQSSSSGEEFHGPARTYGVKERLRDSSEKPMMNI